MFEGRNVHYTSNNKPLCSYSAKLCNLRRLNGYAFCVRHILEDPSAPFKQCAYVVKTSGLRCTSAIKGAEERQYCNAHMQVMGIIPKKERKKKTEPLYLPEGHGIHSLDSIKLPNGVINEENVHNQPNFSASKMFPELAGKLSSSDSQKHSDTTSDKGDSLNKSFTKSSPRSVSGSGSVPSRRARRTTRKALSIQRKKQLGLLTDDEAKALLSSSGCRTYSHYVNMKTDNSELLTPLVESSEDESTGGLRNLLMTHNRYLRDTTSPASPHPACLNSYNYDLNSSTESLYISEPDEQCSNLSDLLDMKKSCLQLSKSAPINCDIVKYQQNFTKSLIETVKDNLSSAVLLVQKIRKVKKKSQDIVDSSPVLSKPGDDVLESRKHCIYPDRNGKLCGASTLPLSTHCLRHISHNAEQRLFGVCGYSKEIEGGEEEAICKHPAIDLGQGISLCPHHTPGATDPYDLELDMNLRKKKKKSKSFASRRSKKRRKNLRPQKPVPSTGGNPVMASSSSDSSLALTNGRQSVNENKPLGSSSPLRSSSPVMAEEEERLDSETENMLSPLADSLLQNDSKILNDNEIDEVLNEENFNIFSTVSDDKHGAGAADLELTDADADLIFNGEDVLDNLGKADELPEDITDAILHVEYLEQQEKQKQQEQQNKQQSLQHHHNMSQQQQHILSPTPAGFDINGTLDRYSDGDFHQLSQSFESHQGPPPEYPGATKHLPTSSQQISLGHVNQASSSMNNYLHEQQTNSRFTHHPIHTKIPSSPSSGSQSQLHLLRQSSYPMTLPPSSTLLNNSAHLVSDRMGRLPPVSTITMQPDWHNSDSTTLYQNGYHNPTEHHLYQHGGLPSPPHYHSTEHRLMYPTSQMFSPGGYGIHHTQRPPQPQRVNMPLQ